MIWMDESGCGAIGSLDSSCCWCWTMLRATSRFALYSQARPTVWSWSQAVDVSQVSRMRLLFCLNTLPPDDAAQLFAHLAARPGLQREDPAVADIVRLCAYLPLAIRLMAGRAASHPAWTIAELAANLAAADNRLTLMRAENTSITAAFDLSYRDLTSEQQRLFRRLGLHPGPDINVYTAAALDAIDLAAAHQCLDDLYDQHLLDEPAPGRYRFHDLIREHARALSAGDPPTDSEEAVRPAARLLPVHRHYCQPVVQGNHRTQRGN